MLSLMCYFIPATAQNNTEDEAEKKIYLLHANTLDFDKTRSADYRILRGDVRLRQDSAYMFCDSAYFY